jgi:chromate transporter
MGLQSVIKIQGCSKESGLFYRGENMWKRQKEIFIAFFRSGILGFGGGPSSIPLMHKEVVETFEFMNDEEFSDCLAIGNTLPGPIATKMAGYIGYRVGGMLGLLNALIATILPTAVVLILFLTVLHEYSDLPFIQGMTNGVVPIVGVMMFVLTWEFIKKGKNALGWKKGMLIFLASFAGIWLFHINPGIIIALLLGLALLLPLKKGDEA